MTSIYRRYALRINKGSYSVWNYFDSKKSLLEELKLYAKDKVKAYVFSNNSYTLLPTS